MKTDHLLKILNVLAEAFPRFQRAEPESMDREIYRSAIIKNYELSQEITFKLLRKAMVLLGYSKSKTDGASAKELLRMAAKHELMTTEEVERWFGYRDNRNDTAHEYGVEYTVEALNCIPAFIDDCKHMQQRLQERWGNESP